MFKFDIFKIDKKTCIALLILVLIFFIAGLFNYYEYLQNKTVIKKYPSNQVVSENKNDKEITIYVCGEVKKPGVYSIDEGLRIKDAISIAQGFTENADVNKVNLASKIYDEDRVYVPSKKKSTARKPAKHKISGSKASKNNISNPPQNSNPHPVDAFNGISEVYKNGEIDENDILINEGVVEVKVNGRVKK